jgi:hypothetical protein
VGDTQERSLIVWSYDDDDDDDDSERINSEKLNVLFRKPRHSQVGVILEVRSEDCIRNLLHLLNPNNDDTFVRGPFCCCVLFCCLLGSKVGKREELKL